ncbi:MAG: DUF433 domain-containing protein [Chloroflexota bacterium]|nr:DUF433 domain-containing protein [Chloroflexota bacterium]
MKTNVNLGRISIDPQVCHGKPCIAGTRIMVTNILSQLAGGYTIDHILEGYPELVYGDVVAAIEYATSVITTEEVLPFTEYAPMGQRRVMAEVQTKRSWVLR